MVAVGSKNEREWDDIHAFMRQRKKEMQRLDKIYKPAIPFYKKKKTGEEDPSKFVSMRIPMSPDIAVEDRNTSNTTERKFALFNSDDIDGYFQYRKDLELIAKLNGQDDDHVAKLQHARALLGPEAQETFNKEYDDLVTANNEADEEEQIDDEDMLDVAMNEFVKELLSDWKNAYRNQVRYLRSVVMNGDYTAAEFCDRLESINKK